MRAVLYVAACWALLLPGLVGCVALAVVRVRRWRDQWTRTDQHALEAWQRRQIAAARALHPSAPRSVPR